MPQSVASDMTIFISANIDANLRRRRTRGQRTGNAADDGAVGVYRTAEVSDVVERAELGADGNLGRGNEIENESVRGRRGDRRADGFRDKSRAMDFRRSGHGQFGENREKRGV